MSVDWKNHFLEKYATLTEVNTRISPDLYEKYNVKRGLRNADGTGVLVGLTEIGDVHGYILDEKEKIPVDGRLRYRGIEIKDFVNGFQSEKRFGYEEVCYLLLFATLPTDEELKEFCNFLGENRKLPENFTEDMILKAPSPDIMNKLARGVLSFYSYDENPEDISIRNVLRQCIELIAGLPAMAAYAYQAKRHYYDEESLFIHPPRPDLSSAENLLHMVRTDSSFSPLEAEVLDLALVLHAEHGGGNNSTFSVHLVSSSDTDTYSAMAAGIGSLKGPKHGGANIKVMKMMANIKENVKDWDDKEEIDAYLTKMIHKEVFDKTGLIYGMGHAVYTVSDPRAVLLEGKALKLAKEKGIEKEMHLYQHVAELAPKIFAREKESDKVISANVDFYSGFVYEMLNIPFELYTPIFAIARVAGWSAHRIEELVSGGRIIRPAYKSVSIPKSYIPLTER